MGTSLEELTMATWGWPQEALGIAAESCGLVKTGSYSWSALLPAELLSCSSRVGAHRRGQNNIAQPQRPFSHDSCSPAESNPTLNPQHL